MSATANGRLPDEAFLVRPLRPDEAEDALRRSVESFGGPAPHGTLERWRARAAAAELWAVEADGVVMAHCRVLAADHWLLGAAMPCQRVASVSVAPEHRGRGAAGALMRAMVRKGFTEGLALSVLFPATTAMYRGLGYELAGRFQRARVSTRDVPPAGPALRRQDPPDWAAIRSCHDRFVRLVHGAGSRGEDRWRELREATEFTYVLDGEDGLEGYALVRHQADPDDWRYILAVEDWAGLTPRGLEAVLGFVGRHGTLAKAAVLTGPAVRLLGSRLPEQDWQLTTDFSWMARGLDFAAAVAARPFPGGMSAELTVAVDDPLLPEVAGPWRVAVESGKGRAEPAGEARVRLHARAVGPLLMGSAGADTLTLGGMADGQPADLALLGGMFASPPPVFLDFF